MNPRRTYWHLEPPKRKPSEAAIRLSQQPVTS